MKKNALILFAALVLLVAATPPSWADIPASDIWPPAAQVTPGSAEIGFYVDGGWHYQKFFRPAELRDGHIYVPLDAVCLIMDTSVGFAGNDCLVLTPTAKKSVCLYVLTSPDTVQKMQKGEMEPWETSVMLSLRELCEAAGYRVTWDGEKAVVANLCE